MNNGKKRGRHKRDKECDIAFALTLRTLLNDNNTTQEELAAVVGVTRQAIGVWKNGDAVPDILNASKIADYFGVSLDYLVGRTNMKNPAGWNAEKEELMAELTKCRNMLRTVSNGLRFLSHEAIGALPDGREEPNENT